MDRAGFSSSKKVFCSVLYMAALMLLSHGALADTAGDGCNPAVWRAMNAKAQAKVAYDVAATEQIIKKPDSVLALTCFNNAAGISAATGGNIFSGNFTEQLAPIIEDALGGFYSNFTDSIGALGGVVDYGNGAITLGTNANCDKIKKLWDKVAQTGTEKGAPAVTFRDLIDNTIPQGSGTEFVQNMTAEASTLTELKNAVEAVPIPQNTFTNYNNGDTLCEYLQQNNLSSNCN